MYATLRATIDQVSALQLGLGPLPVTTGRVAHHEYATGSQQSRRQGQQHLGGRKTPRGHHVDQATSGHQFIGKYLRICLHNSDMIAEIECPDGETQQIGSFGATLHELEPQRGKPHTDHQSRQTATRPEIDGSAGRCGDGRDKAIRMSNSRLEIYRADSASALDFAKDAQ